MLTLVASTHRQPEQQCSLRRLLALVNGPTLLRKYLTSRRFAPTLLLSQHSRQHLRNRDEFPLVFPCIIHSSSACAASSLLPSSALCLLLLTESQTIFALASTIVDQANSSATTPKHHQTAAMHQHRKNHVPSWAKHLPSTTRPARWEQLNTDGTQEQPKETHGKCHSCVRLSAVGPT